MSKRSIGYIKKVKDGKYFLRLSCGYDDFGRRIQHHGRYIAAATERPKNC